MHYRREHKYLLNQLLREKLFAFLPYQNANEIILEYLVYYCLAFLYMADLSVNLMIPFIIAADSVGYLPDAVSAESIT